jgi:hypothetical protein
MPVSAQVIFKDNPLIVALAMALGFNAVVARRSFLAALNSTLAASYPEATLATSLLRKQWLPAALIMVGQRNHTHEPTAGTILT